VSNLSRSTVTKTLEDSAYVAVGLGLLGFQRAQVRRRELESQFAGPLAVAEDGLRQAWTEIENLASQVGEQSAPLLSQARAQVEPLWAQTAPARQRLAASAAPLREQLAVTAAPVRAQVATAISDAQARLPFPARVALVSARMAAKESERRLRARLGLR
jgi:hypothetical protein